MGCGGSKNTQSVSASAMGDSTENKTTENTNTSDNGNERNTTEIENKLNQTDDNKKEYENTANESETIKTYKIVLVGDERVGKTCVSTRFVRDDFIDMYLPTLGPESKTKSLMIEGKAVKLQILDTSGNERFRQQTSTSLSDADGVIIVFDFNNRGSLNNIGFWHKMVASIAPANSVVALAGNKCDIPGREVTDEDAMAVAQICGTEFVEISAKDNLNLDMLFMKVGAKLFTS